MLLLINGYFWVVCASDTNSDF